MRDPVAWTRGLHRTFAVTERRAGLSGALVDLIAPRRRTHAAVVDLDLDVFAGEIVGLLGPNGAGKSTTVKCLTGLLQPTAGEVRVLGLDPWARRTEVVRRVGVMFGQRSQLWWDLAVREAYDLLAAIHRVPRATYRERLDALATTLELTPLLAKPVRELSLGQRARCELAASLLHDPALLVLDEPTIGLDVGVKRRLRTLVRERARQGTAVLLTTHDLADVDHLCDRVVLVDKARVVFEGTVPELRTQLGGQRRVRVRTADRPGDDELAALTRRVRSPVRIDGDGVVEVVVPAGRPVAHVLREVLSVVFAEDVSVVEPTLEGLLADWYERAAEGTA
ncbi:MAG: ATP-binding cassette domain-containing protein [Alphaproteobacteria bacterium]|nr:ATP-binding cassette domain-containing protein [Alphaproteobacteria bacterium]